MSILKYLKYLKIHRGTVIVVFLGHCSKGEGSQTFIHTIQFKTSGPIDWTSGEPGSDKNHPVLYKLTLKKIISITLSLTRSGFKHLGNGNDNALGQDRYHSTDKDKDKDNYQRYTTGDGLKMVKNTRQ